MFSPRALTISMRRLPSTYRHFPLNTVSISRNQVTSVGQLRLFIGFIEALNRVAGDLLSLTSTGC